MDNRTKEYFDKNPNIEGVYKTSDGFMFLKEYDAKKHAQTLEDSKVSTVYNPDLPEVETEDEDDEFLEDDYSEDQE